MSICLRRAYHLPLSVLLLKWFIFLNNNYIIEKKDNEFHIHLPKNNDRNPYTYNYLSKTAERVFMSKIRQFYEMVFHERMCELRNAGYQKKECVELFIDENNLKIEDYDRLIKDFQRWQTRLRVKKHYKRHRKKSKKTLPKCFNCWWTTSSRINL